MNTRHNASRRDLAAVWVPILFLLISAHAWGQPATGASAWFTSYSEEAEFRLARQHRSAESFLSTIASGSATARSRLNRGEQIIEGLSPAADQLHGAMLHHWRGTAFAPGARVTDFERLMRDVNGYPRFFSPQVLRTRLVSESGDRMQMEMRLCQRHVVTVVLDSTYDVAFGQFDARHGYSISRSRRIEEIDAAGTSGERPLRAEEEHGFLWRLNTYWSYEERDGGLYLQIEAISLTRSIPAGVGWAIRPYVESIPRESLEFTLRSVCDELRRREHLARLRRIGIDGTAGGP